MRISYIRLLLILTIGMNTVNYNHAQNTSEQSEIESTPHTTTGEADQWYHKTGRALFGATIGALDSIVPTLIGYSMLSDPEELYAVRHFQDDLGLQIMYFPVSASITSCLSAGLISFLGRTICLNHDKYYRIPHAIMHILCNLQLHQHEKNTRHAPDIYYEQTMGAPSHIFGIPIPEALQQQIAYAEAHQSAEELDAHCANLSKMYALRLMQITCINTSTALGSLLG